MHLHKTSESSIEFDSRWDHHSVQFVEPAGNAGSTKNRRPSAGEINLHIDRFEEFFGLTCYLLPKSRMDSGSVDPCNLVGKFELQRSLLSDLSPLVTASTGATC
jgi:hypothetical protein